MNTFKKMVVVATLIALNSGITSAGGDMPTLSKEHKMFAIESLRTYEEAIESGEITPPVQASGIEFSPFVCVDEHEQSCEMQEWLYNDRNAQSIPQPAMFADGKYKVSISFQSGTPHPLKYVGKDKFESVPETGQAVAENKILEQHLGHDYLSYTPALVGASSEGATIEIWVRSSDELLTFADDPTVQGIYHINNSGVFEGYSLDGYNTIREEH